MASTLYPTPTICPVCGKAAEELPKTFDQHDLDCSGTCGRYAIEGGVMTMLEHHPLDDREKALLAEWITRQHQDGEERPLIWIDVLTAVTGRSGIDRGRF
jgi:hypothetical protein